MHYSLAQEAARIFVEGAHTDYGVAKRKAAERLGLGRGHRLPENREIEALVLEYQRLFGGAAYAQRLDTLRRTALRLMEWLKDFEPRLVGAVVSGAISQGHRIQLHCFADQPEFIDEFLRQRGLDPLEDERRVRYPSGEEEDIPLTRFMAGDVGVDIAHFASLHHAPVSPVTGKPHKRLDVDAVRALVGVGSR